MTKKQDRIVLLFMGINALAFMVIFLIVSGNQRLAVDDFHYLVKTQELGIWDSTIYYYNHWNTRWASSLLRASFLSIFDSSIVLSAVNCFSLMLGLFSIQSLVKGLASATQIPISVAKQWVISGYLLMVVFLATFG